MKISRISISISFIISAILGCGGEPTDNTPPFAEASDSATSASMEPIIGGVPATDFPEAAILNMKSKTGAMYACSAAVIAPRVVLTAGHCVDGMTTWDVYVGTLYRSASGAETMDWNENGATTVNPNHHDIGLVYLKEALPTSSIKFPTLASSPVANNTRVINVGRILNGKLTNQLYKATVQVSDGKSVGFPFDYYSKTVIEHGDSGGPVFQEGTHTIIAVNSGANTNLQVLARVDLVRTWISERLTKMNSTTPPGTGTGGAPTTVPTTGGKGGSGGTKGGSNSAAGGKPGANGGASAGKGGASSPSAPVAPCLAETEPNNTLTTANKLSSTLCGRIATKDDVDYALFTAPTGVTKATLSPELDATFQIGFFASGKCNIALSGQKATAITVNGGSTQVCLVISSSSKLVQNYRITLTR